MPKKFACNYFSESSSIRRKGGRPSLLTEGSGYRRKSTKQKNDASERLQRKGNGFFHGSNASILLQEPPPPPPIYPSGSKSTKDFV